MKIVRWAAVAAVGLMSLMNVGTALGGDNAPPVAVIIGAVIVGLLGLAVAYGLARHVSWGRPAALAIGAVNLLAAVIGLITDSEGAIIGIAVSALIIVLTFFATDGAAPRQREEIPVG